jgi:hypothetical protein
MFKRLFFAIAFFVSLVIFVPGPIVLAQPHALQQTEDPKTTTVYITRTGKKYHRAGCRYLSHSQIKTTLAEAKANGYTPCKVCNPPS